jgi:hypothetical protein
VAVLVDIDHDANNLSEYDSTVTDGGDLSTTVAGLGSSPAKMKVVIDDTTAIYGIKDLGGGAGGKLRIRYHIDPNTLTFATAQSFYVLEWKTDGGGTLGASYLGHDGSNYYIRTFIMDDTSTPTYLTNQTITDEEHYIETYWQRASSDVAGDATVQLWIDGVSKDTSAGVDLYDIWDTLDVVYFGATATIDADTSGTFYLDELVANDDGAEIGPAGPDTPGGSTVIYEFTARNAGVANPWDTNPGNMVNGTETDFAETDSNADEEELVTNECTGTDLGLIDKVELRAYGYGDGSDQVHLAPDFSVGGQGADYTVLVSAVEAWSAWQDITDDGAAGDWLNWNQVQNLDCFVEYDASGKANTMYCGMVQIQVTYIVIPSSSVSPSVSPSPSVSVSPSPSASVSPSPSASVSPSSSASAQRFAQRKPKRLT